jgi:hypothetical protein
MKGTTMTALGLVVLAGVLVWLSMGLQEVECDVCIEFKGRRNCATAAAASQPEAVRSGRTTACALLASGVRDGFACDSTPPASVSCR